MRKVARRRKLRMMRRNVKWFVEQQSGDEVLAHRLRDEFESGWLLTTRLLRQGTPSGEIVKHLRDAGYSAALIKKGVHEQQIPGRSVTFLLMDREHGAQQITLEKWRSISDTATNLLLIGIGRRDYESYVRSEKQIHLAAFELPRRGDYLEITTESLSPIGKVVIVFVAASLLTGCEEKPAQPPVPPPVQAPPPPKVTINRKGSSDHGYAASGGRPYPLGFTGKRPAHIPPSEGLPNGFDGDMYLHAIEVCFPSGSTECRNHVKQSMRDTVTYGDGTSERKPPAQGSDLGGHDSSSWAPDPPPDGVNPATQQNADGTSSYIDAPGLGIGDRSQLPATKRTTYRWEIIDCHGNVLDCQQAEYTLTIDANGVGTADFSLPKKCP